MLRVTGTVKSERTSYENVRLLTESYLQIYGTRMGLFP